jgi:hypothetical protein
VIVEAMQSSFLVNSRHNFCKMFLCDFTGMGFGAILPEYAMVILIDVSN